MRQDKRGFTLSLVEYREHRNQPVTPHEGEMQPPSEVIREYFRKTLRYCCNQKDGMKIAYKPRTCPFCNFWGPRKRPDGKFSCDMCGLEWKPEQDKRDKDKQ